MKDAFFDPEHVGGEDGNTIKLKGGVALLPSFLQTIGSETVLDISVVGHVTLS